VAGGLCRQLSSLGNKTGKCAAINFHDRGLGLTGASPDCCKMLVEDFQPEIQARRVRFNGSIEPACFDSAGRLFGSKTKTSGRLLIL
jgi:hypothetical protein